MFKNKKGVTLRTIAIAIIIILVVIGAAAWYFFTPRGPAKSEEYIKIAALTNLSGGVAGMGIRAKILWDALADDINVKGGVYVKETGAYHPIQLIYYDCESSPTRSAELATKVATEAPALKVKFIFIEAGPPPITIPAIINIEKVGGTPSLSESCVDVQVAQAMPACPGGKFTWNWACHFSLIDLVEQNEMPFLASIKGKTNGVLGIVFEDDPDGVFLVESMKVLDRLQNIGYKVIYPGRITPGTKDLTPVITRFKEANVEVIYANCMPDTGVTFLSQGPSLGFKPKTVLISRSITAAGSPDAFGNAVIGVVKDLFWWKDYTYPGNDWIRENWDRISGGLFYCAFEGYAYTWMQIVLEAVKIAGSLDPKAINDAMLKIDFQGPIGRVKFDPATHVCKGTVTLGQIFKTAEGKWNIPIVWAPEGSGIPTQQIVFPKPWP